MFKNQEKHSLITSIPIYSNSGLIGVYDIAGD